MEPKGVILLAGDFAMFGMTGWHPSTILSMEIQGHIIGTDHGKPLIPKQVISEVTGGMSFTLLTE